LVSAIGFGFRFLFLVLVLDLDFVSDTVLLSVSVLFLEFFCLLVCLPSLPSHGQELASTIAAESALNNVQQTMQTFSFSSVLDTMTKVSQKITNDVEVSV
jgi:hypothetical protein